MTKRNSLGARDGDPTFCFGARPLEVRAESARNSQWRRFSKSLLAACVVFVLTISAPQSARAKDKEFGLLVHYVESHYHAHRQYRFLLGFASFAVNVVRPYGVKGMKLALWENRKFTPTQDDLDFPAVVSAGLAQGWQPMVRVWSRHDGERVVVFARPDGKDMKLLVATVDKEEAVVVQVKINPEKLSKCIDQWSREDRHEHHGGQGDDDPPPMQPAEGEITLADSM